MDREKMIDEILYKFCERHGIEDKCYDSGKKCADMSCAIRLIATKIVNKYIPEGSVVLTKEEYERLKNQVKWAKELGESAKKIRNETAREILQTLKMMIKEPWQAYELSFDDLHRIAEKYGVEVEE